LKQLEKELPERTQVLGGSGSTSPGDMLKKLGAFRLLRHCRMRGWELAAQMSARVLPKGKALYDNQAAWIEAAREINDLLEAVFTTGGYDPIR
jgi:hypothetical protein